MTPRKVALVSLWAVVNAVSTMTFPMQPAYSSILAGLPEAVMQWAILQFFARIGWLWIAAGVAIRYASGALTPIVWESFGRPSGSSSRYLFLALNVILSIPIAGLLAYYTKRSRGFMWVAAAPLGFLVSRPLLSFFPRSSAGRISPAYDLSPQTLILLLAIGAVEGLVLVYILGDRIDSRAEAARQATTAEAPVLPVAHAVLMAMSMVGFGILGLNDLGERDESLAWFAIGIAVSLAAGLALLSKPQTRAIGAALGFGAGLVALIPISFFGGYILLVGRLDPIMLLLSAVQIGLLVSGVMAVRRHPLDQRKAWLAGIIGPITFVAAITAAALSPLS